MLQALQVIFVALICLVLAAVAVMQIIKCVFAIKSKGETLKPKGDRADETIKGGKEE